MNKFKAGELVRVAVSGLRGIGEPPYLDQLGLFMGYDDLPRANPSARVLIDSNE